MNLDTLAAVGCFWIALVFFALHTYSSPRQRSWITLPTYLRWGFLVTGALFLWRGANFLSLRPGELGHANREAILVQLALAYTVSSLCVWVLGSRLREHCWDRIRWLQDLLRKDPDLAPVAVKVGEVATIARAAGIRALPPEAPPEALLPPKVRTPAGDLI